MRGNPRGSSSPPTPGPPPWLLKPVLPHSGIHTWSWGSWPGWEGSPFLVGWTTVCNTPITAALPNDHLEAVL